MKLYYACVESRNDPDKLGRCRVRVVGVHTDNKTVLPVADLPWAQPIQPITSAAMNGIGHTPMGPVEGTWVVVVFKDEGSFQEPLILGTIGGIPADPHLVSERTDDLVTDAFGSITNAADPTTAGLTSYNPDDPGAVSVDSNGNQINKTQILNSSNSPSSTQSSASSSVSSGSMLDKIGELTANRESGNVPTMVNDYLGKASGDLGGASYGCFQFASYMPATSSARQNALSKGKSPVLQFIESSGYSSTFAGMTPGTPAFDKAWVSLASDPNFKQKQYEFARSVNYAPQVRKNPDLGKRGYPIQEMLFSIGVWLGPNTSVVTKALNGKDISTMCDAEIVQTCFDYIKNNVQTLFRSSPSYWNGIRNRCTSESAELLALCDACGEQTEKAPTIPPTGQEDITPAQQAENQRRFPPPPGRQRVSNKLGFRDPQEYYPRKSWVGESDVHRLARNEKIDNTIVRVKEQNRVTNVNVACGGKVWEEPKSKYNSKYPLNHVTCTESGHVIELDDTVGAERVQIYHRQGSFIEFHPDGNIVFRTQQDNFEINLRDKKIYVGGDYSLSVKGKLSFLSEDDMTFETKGDFKISSNKNVNIIASDTAILSGNTAAVSASDTAFLTGYTAAVSGRGDTYVNAREVLHLVGLETTDREYRSFSVETGNVCGDTLDVSVNRMILDDGTVELYENDSDETVPKNEESTAISNGMTEIQSQDAATSTPTTPEPTPPGTPDDVITDDRLSTHYWVKDLAKNGLKAQYGLTEQQILENLRVLATTVLEPLLAIYGPSMNIVSGLRYGNTQAGNGRVSQHCKGQAVDLQFSDVSRADPLLGINRAREIMAAVDFDQFILEHQHSEVFHVSAVASGNRHKPCSTFGSGNSGILSGLVGCDGKKYA
jgi:hypothetical protein